MNGQAANILNSGTTEVKVGQKAKKMRKAKGKRRQEACALPLSKEAGMTPDSSEGGGAWERGELLSSKQLKSPH